MYKLITKIELNGEIYKIKKTGYYCTVFYLNENPKCIWYPKTGIIKNNKVKFL